MIVLKDWQTEALKAVYAQEKGSIVEAATGAGKTILGLKIVEDNPKSKFLIVVPTIVLQKQWKEELKKFGLGTDETISLIGGGNKDVPKTNITIAVINSLRDINWKHDLATFDYVICDEVHRYGSLRNMRFLRKGNFGYVLGLTATLERSDGNEDTLKELIGEVVYTLSNKDAVDLGYVSDYTVLVVGCDLSEKETVAYKAMTIKVNDSQKIIGTLDNALKLIGRRNNKDYTFALQYLKSIQNRKKLIADVVCKRDVTEAIVHRNYGSKIIIFDELQESANRIYNRLQERYGDDVVLYHSGIPKKEKEEAIRRYKENEASILVSVRALDEGLDVKSANVGIIVNGNSQKRQALQRLGRVLRVEDNKEAKLYMLLAKNTIEEKYIEKRMKFFDAATTTIYNEWSFYKEELRELDLLVENKDGKKVYVL